MRTVLERVGRMDKDKGSHQRKQAGGINKRLPLVGCQMQKLRHAQPLLGQHHEVQGLRENAAG